MTVYPAVCATQYKFPQKQADISGGYIIDKFRVVDGEVLPLYKVKDKMI